MKEILINKLIEEIKSKSQIKDLENQFFEEKINKYFLTNGDKRKQLEQEYKKKQEKINKSKIFKEIVKEIREITGIIYGSFLTNEFSKKEKILKKIKTKEEVNTLLKLHKSTRERYNFYNEVYSKIFEKFSPQKIADFGCGLNPTSYFLIQKQLKYNPKYFATDLNPKDMDFLNQFFKKYKIDGIAKNYDLTNLYFLNEKELINCDLAFFFKSFDSLEEIKRGITKEILEKLPINNIIVSFPTKSLISKKEFKNKKKGWLKKIIDENNWKYEQFEVENEIFFLIKKSLN